MTTTGEEPQTWHYGLMARWWAEFNLDAGEEAPFFQAIIERSGQPALDLACGTGRILAPLLKAGLEVDGCDLSPDMIARCRERAAQEGFAPGLYAQAMHALDLPRRYRTIYICGGFGLGATRAQDAEALRRCHRQLVPGGTLVFDHHLPYEDATRWSAWLPGGRRGLPAAWPAEATRRRIANGDELELRTRLVALDPLAQRQTLEMRIALRRDGAVVAEEQHLLHENFYFVPEILLLLNQAGFREVRVLRAYTDEPATADDVVVVFVARF
jgi:SAM-dependent methyltransferase